MKKWVIALIVAIGCLGIAIFLIYRANQESEKKKVFFNLIGEYYDKKDFSLAEKLITGYVFQNPTDANGIAWLNKIEKAQKEEGHTLNELLLKQNDLLTANLKNTVMALKIEKDFSNKLDRYIALSSKTSNYKPPVIERQTIPPISIKNEPTLIPPETMKQLEVITADAIKAFDNGDTTSAHRQLGEVLKIDEQNPQANTYFAACLFKEDPDKAENKKLIIKFCQIALKKDNSIELAHFLLARTYQAQGQVDLSIQEYKQTLALNPKNYEASYYLGKIFYEKGEYSEAVRLLLTASGLKPDWTDVLYYLALSSEKKGDTMTTKKYLNQICEKDKAFFAAYQKLGDICFADKDYESALRAYLGANQINTNWQSLLGSARCCIELNKLNDARTYYLEAFKFNKTNTPLINEMMELLVKLNDYSKAVEMAENISPITSRLWYLVGFSLYKTNKQDKAESAFLEAVKLDGNNYDAIYSLCELYLKQNEKTEAKKYFDILMAKAPEYKSEELLVIKKKLEEK